MNKYFITKDELGEILKGMPKNFINKTFSAIKKYDVERLKKEGKGIPENNIVTKISANDYLKSYGIEV